MSKLNLIAIAGQAGSGKDTVGNYLASNDGLGVTIGQADPIKRFLRDIFNFTDEQLWGPSHMRNAQDDRFLYPTKSFLDYTNWRFDHYHRQWIDEIFPDFGWWKKYKARRALRTWFDDILSRAARFEPISPRLCLMLLGTEFGRAVYQDVWVEYMIRAARTLTTETDVDYSRKFGVVRRPLTIPYANVICTDVRFFSELCAIQRAGGRVIKVVRPDSSLSADALTAGIQGHSSEAELTTISDDEFDWILVNDGTLEDLYGEILVMLLEDDF